MEGPVQSAVPGGRHREPIGPWGHKEKLILPLFPGCCCALRLGFEVRQHHAGPWHGFPAGVYDRASYRRCGLPPKGGAHQQKREKRHGGSPQNPGSARAARGPDARGDARISAKKSRCSRRAFRSRRFSCSHTVYPRFPLGWNENYAEFSADRTPSLLRA